jgi:hypothetical protein
MMRRLADRLRSTVVLPWTGLMAVMACLVACGGRATTTTATSHAEASAAGESSAETGSAEDAGDAALCPVLSSQYDQSCARDSDCLVVNETLSCPAMMCSFCGTGVINKQAEASYMAAFSAATADVALDAGLCNCGAVGEPCCRMGLCQHCD